MHGEALGGLELDLLPLQGAGRLLRRYRPQVDGEVHGDACGHEALQEAGRQRPGPLAQVQRPGEVPADAKVAPVDLHVHRRVLVHLLGRASQGRGQQQHPKGAAREGMHAQSALGQQGAKLVGPLHLADCVEAPVQDAVAGLQLRKQSLKGLCCVMGLLGQVLGLGLKQLSPQPLQARRVLAYQQLHLEVAGVEGSGEGSQLRLVQLQPQHLADPDLHPVEAHGSVFGQVGEHECVGQRRERFGGDLLGLLGAGLRPAQPLAQGRAPSQRKAGTEPAPHPGSGSLSPPHHACGYAFGSFK